MTTPAACQSCHHRQVPSQPGKSCLTCHERGDGVLDRHSDVVHSAPGACTACHEAATGFPRWTRQICTLCHVQQAAGHYEEESRSPSGCELCHEKPALQAPPG